VIQIENYLLLFFFILAASLGAFFYIKRQRLQTIWIRYILGALRFLSIFSLLLLLLSPILKCNKTKSIRPKLVLLVDNSRSIKFSDKENFKSEVEKLVEKLADLNLFIDVKAFDEEVKPIDSLSQNGQRTDIISALTSIVSLQTEENIQRIVLVTDGNHNQGNNPIFFNNKALIPLDVILIGDTTRISDFRLENIEGNSIILKDDINVVNTIISGSSIEGGQLSISLEELTASGSRIIQEKTIKASKGDFSESVQFELSGLTKGMHHIRANIKTSINELNLRNNSKDIFIDVLDGSKQIEILSNFPHPDISALKFWLNSNKSFKVKVAIAESNLSFSESTDLVILYQLPNQLNNAREIITKAKASGKSILFFLGTQTDYNAFNQSQKSYRIQVKGNFLQDYTAKLNPSFSKFYLREVSNTVFQNYSPLSNYLLTIEPLKGANHLLLARIGRTESEQPLISFSNEDNIQIGLVAGENIWKWKVNNYQTRKNFEETQDLLYKMVNYLAIRKDKKQLITSMSNHSIAEGESFIISANTYNEIYQPTKAKSINCKINGGELDWKQYEMLPLENSYSISPKDLKQGNYHYKIEANIAGKVYLDEGKFSIYKDDIEDIYSPSNYEDMNTLAIKSGGNLILWRNRGSHDINVIKENQKEKLISETQRLKANDILWLLLFILITLSIEWLLRKYFALN
jgi:hypothetical protein